MRLNLTVREALLLLGLIVVFMFYLGVSARRGLPQIHLEENGEWFTRDGNGLINFHSSWGKR